MKSHIYNVECRRIVYGRVRVRAHNEQEALSLAKQAHGESLEDTVISIELQPLSATPQGALDPIDEALSNL